MANKQEHVLVKKLTKTSSKTSIKPNPKNAPISKAKRETGIIPHIEEYNTKIYNLDYISIVLSNNVIFSYISDATATPALYKYNEKTKQFIRVCKIKYPTDETPRDMILYGYNDKFTEIYARLHRKKYSGHGVEEKLFIYTPKTRKWKKQSKGPMLCDRIYKAILINDNLHFFCNTDYPKNSHDIKMLTHMIWDTKQNKMRADKTGIIGMDKRRYDDLYIYHDNQLNVLYCIHRSKFGNMINILWCNLNHIQDLLDATMYEWEEVTVRIPNVCFNTNEIMLSIWKYRFIIMHGSIIILFCWSNRCVYYMDFLDKNKNKKKWRKCKDKIPKLNVKGYNAKWPIEKWISLVTTDDDMIHLIQHPNIAKVTYHVGIEMVDIVTKAMLRDKDTMLSLINGFIFNINQTQNYKDIIQLIYTYYFVFA